MPTYEYLCTSCAHEFETFQSMKDDALTDCPVCPEGRVRRKIGLGAGIIFKGSGFYETDFKDRKGTKPADEGSASSESQKAETTPSAGEKKESKPAPAAAATATASSD